MRTFFFIVLLLIGRAMSAADATAYTNEPNGFQGLSWGVPAGTLVSKDDFVGFSSEEKSFKYLKLSDSTTLAIDNVTLYGMVYSFYNGKLWKVDIEARLLQADKLLDLFRGKYGEPSRDTYLSEYRREYIWAGAVTDIILTTSLNFFDRKKAVITTASIYSTQIKNEIEAGVSQAPTDRILPIDSVVGFRGYTWGSGFARGLTYLPLEKEPFFVYLIKDDPMVFEDVNAEQIRYRFYNNKTLQKIELLFNGKQNYLKLKAACFKKFGNSSRYENGEIRWIGKHTTVVLSFSVDAKGLWQSRLSYLGFGSQ